VTGYRADRGPEELIPDCGYGLVSGTSGSILIDGDRSGKMCRRGWLVSMVLGLGDAAGMSFGVLTPRGSSSAPPFR
jgi:hypothetical protein